MARQTFRHVVKGRINVKRHFRIEYRGKKRKALYVVPVQVRKENRVFFVFGNRSFFRQGADSRSGVQDYLAAAFGGDLNAGRVSACCSVNAFGQRRQKFLARVGALYVGALYAHDRGVNLGLNVFGRKRSRQRAPRSPKCNFQYKNFCSSISWRDQTFPLLTPLQLLASPSQLAWLSNTHDQKGYVEHWTGRAP